MKQLHSTTGTIVLVAFVELSVTLPAAGGWQELGGGCDALQSKLSRSSSPRLHADFV